MKAVRIAVVWALVGSVGWACGPFFPNAYLIWGGESDVLRMPEASFYFEMTRILGIEPEDAVDGYYYEENTAWERTLDADAADVLAAVTGAGVSAEDAEPIVADYRSLRETMDLGMPLPSVFPDEASDSWDYAPETPDSIEKKPTDLDSYAALFARLPREFLLYLRGAAAYRMDRFDEAAAYWQELLDLPEEARQYRSTWAAYMLGKVHMRSDTQAAWNDFEKTIELARAGFGDSLNFAMDAVGWQSRIAADNGDYVNAIRLATVMLGTESGTERRTAYNSIRVLMSRALSTPETAKSIAQDELCRRLGTAWVVSHPSATAEWRTMWLDTVASLGLPTPIDQADRLAWIAYETGDMEQAATWLASADMALPYAQWVQSKLLMRAGNVDQAVEVLRAAANAFPENDAWSLGEFGEMTNAKDIARAELGVLLLGRQNYVEALDTLVRSGYWMDASYVAERVLTVEELKGYVDAHGNDEALTQPMAEGYWYDESLTRLDLLRYLLARRLARANDWDAALPYFPEEWKEPAQKLVAALDAGSKPSSTPSLFARFGEALNTLYTGRPPVVVDEPRADRLYEAATILREFGMELAGTELEPDWRSFDGMFALEGPTEIRALPDAAPDASLPDALGRALSASADEKARVAKSGPAPNERFHYRFTAADLAWESAQWLPDYDEKTVSVLYHGGVWIENQDPKAADRFYKALIWRNWSLPFAREADALRWFPDHAPEDGPASM